MNHFVPRTCTEIAPDGSRQPGIPLGALRDRPAYVLLGEPGAGKTRSFEREAEESGGIYVTARDFIAFSPRPEWQGKPIFIDGLDEIRAGSTNNRTPLDEIRRKLDELERPTYRLSCREADWFGATDREGLARISPNGTITICHLDLLTPTQIETLLVAQHHIDDPRAFVDRARMSGLDSLLGNPQTLWMLAEAIKEGGPDNRTALYDLACRKLAEEPNKKHRDAQRQRRHAAEEVLDAAGQLFAVQLLAGLAGYAMDAEAADPVHPEPNAIGLKVAGPSHEALASRLFEAKGKEEQREPTHRSVAEFLGARFLAKKIDQQALPLGRVRALMAAGDRGVVSDLRGLHAWLAVHCLSARDTLIEEDPLGVVLYGDPRSFATETKRRVLQALGREAERYAWFRSQDWTDHPFGTLADPAMLPDFKEILAAEGRAEADESLLDCVLVVLTHGMPLPGLGEPLLAVIGDSSHWERNRHAAIDAFQNCCPDQMASLRDVLADIRSGKCDDPSDELTGMLLERLYPVHLTVAEVVKCLHPPKDPRLIGSYLHFWEHSLFRKTPLDGWVSLLDQVASHQYDARLDSDDYRSRRFLGELLARGLENCGGDVPAEDLWRWLGIGLDEHQFGRLDEEHRVRVVTWLTEHPQALLALIDMAVQNCMDRDDPIRCLLGADRRLHHAPLPQGGEDWWFQKASGLGHPDVRRYLCDRGIGALIDRLGWTPTLLDELLAVGVHFPALTPLIERWLTCEWEDWRQESAQRKATNAEEDGARIADWQRHFHEHQAAIAAGTAPPGVMNQIAMIYFGRYREAQGDLPAARIQSFFGGDAAAVPPILSGLKGTLYRSDLPPVDEIIRLDTDGRHHYIAEACLAGAELLHAKDLGAWNVLPEDVYQRLVAFRLVHDFDTTPAWFATLAKEQPTLFAKVLIDYAKAMFKARKSHVSGIYPLAHDDVYRHVARQAVLPILAAFPLRVPKEQLGLLTTLLTAALKHGDRVALRTLVEAKLARPSIDKAQCSRWLAAGFILDPASYESRLSDYVGTSQSRAIQVAALLDGRLNRAGELPEFTDSALALLVRLLAPHVSHERPRGAHWVSPELSTADLVRSLISRLAERPTAQAADALAGLLACDELRAWHAELRHGRESQRLVLREAQFQRADAAAVINVLANGTPANARDLRALLTWQLHDLAIDDRNGNTTGYKKYWNVDQHDKPTEPRPENNCRDRLLELLRQRLRNTGVDLQPECEYRENKRADIRASVGGIDGFNIPIEIKRDRHQNVWHAVRDQLMAQYAVAPGTNGNGIYLVFWFGGWKMPVAADGGPPPKSPQELERRLIATLTDDERRHIEVIVMDCSPT